MLVSAFYTFLMLSSIDCQMVKWIRESGFGTTCSLETRKLALEWETLLISVDLGSSSVL